MSKSIKNLGFVFYVAFAHCITYFICGMIFSQVMDYSGWWKQPVVCDYFRDFDGMASAAGPFVQIGRGLLFGLVLILMKDFVKEKFGWLKLWIVFLGIGIIGAPAAAPSSIEGAVYSKLPLAFHLVGLPELCSQTLLFSLLIYRHLNPSEKKSEKTQLITRSFISAVIVFMGYAAVSIVFALLQNVPIEKGSADIKILGQFFVPVILVFVCSLVKKFNLFVKLGILYVLSAVSFLLYQGLVLKDTGVVYAFVAPAFTTLIYFLYVKICGRLAKKKLADSDNGDIIEE